MADLGRSDVPVESADVDKLGMAKYASALARFVLECETPMTVGIQGEWGSGKTSLMRMMQAKIRADCKLADETAGPPWLHVFETWQYGAIGDDANLGLHLLVNLTAEITSRHSEDGIIARAGATIGRLSRFLGRAVAAGTVNAATGGLLDGGTLVGGGGEPAGNAVDLMQLKGQFKKLVDQVIKTAAKTKGAPPARLILFVDDLDRVRPDRAVSMLEVLKNFMDVSGVVFVVACDYEVVRQGVRLRFGIEDEDKARAFFDKIIQVPFHMPVASYDVTRLLTEFLSQRVPRVRGYLGTASRYSERLAPMVRIATGSNPRAFKRFLNAVDLHARLDHETGPGSGKPGDATTTPDALEVWATAEGVYALVGLIALQLRWPRTAAYLVGQREPKVIALSLELLAQGMMEDDIESADQDLVTAVETDSARAAAGLALSQRPAVIDLASFANHFWSLLDTQPQDNALTADELEKFMKLGSQISLTDVSRAEARAAPWYDFVDTLRQKAVPWAGRAISFTSRLFEERGEYPHITMYRQADHFSASVSFNGRMPQLFSLRITGELRHNLTEHALGRLDGDLRHVLSEAATRLTEESTKHGISWSLTRKTTAVLNLAKLQETRLASVEELIKSVMQLVSTRLGEVFHRARSASATSVPAFPSDVGPVPMQSPPRVSDSETGL